MEISKIKRSLLGYSSISVLDTIQSKQNSYQLQLSELRKKIQEEKEWAQQLRAENPTEKKNEQSQTPEKIHLLARIIVEQEIAAAKLKADLKAELDEKEASVQLELEMKKVQKEAAETRMQEALNFLRKLPSTKNRQERDLS